MTCALIDADFEREGQNMNLQHHLDSGSLEFVDLLDGPEELRLRSIVDRVMTSLAVSQDRQTLVILDDVSMLEWTGRCSSISLHRFLRALRSVTQKVRLMQTQTYLRVDV